MVADVFSGVGSMGMESLSRGAKFVTFVKKTRESATARRWPGSPPCVPGTAVRA